MAMIGRNAAVAEIGPKRHEFDGPIAFAAWLGVHALLLSGVRERMEAFIEWSWNYFGHSRGGSGSGSKRSVADRLGRGRWRAKTSVTAGCQDRQVTS